ncbi:MAG TPA: biotin--[acetyl-CoA-carboxylase] ligase [Feifaniaceae bacterium]|nr:biotin--[acetyl-CoA-carboxylase] ligase [Feifaniaceae bacterium]
MRNAILKMLQENPEGYVSGARISEQLGVSRTAVWKHIQALQREGIVIEAVTNRGYRIIGAANVLHPAFVTPMLKTKWLGRGMTHLNSVPSTNQLARQMAAEGCAHGTAVLAEEQTAGRGRLGRGWTNLKGKDICMSMVLRPRLEAQHAPRYTLASALGVYRLAEELGTSPVIKWPNDVLINGKKICGILLEMTGDMDALQSVIVGVGLNVNTDAFPAEIEKTATSLSLSTGKTLDRNRVLSMLLNLLEPLYDACESEEAYAGLLREYTRCCGTIGQAVSVTGIRETLSGVAEGIDGVGRLLLRSADGTLRALSAGDVTLKKTAQ